MRSPIHLLATGLALVLASEIRAQSPESAIVLRTVARFVRDSLPKQPIVVDNEIYRSRPAITSAEANEVARDINAARGRFSDIIHCVPGAGRTRMKSCTARESKTVLAFAQPVIQRDSAEVEVYWVYVYRGRLVGTTAKLALLRRGADQWLVSSMRRTGHS